MKRLPYIVISFLLLLVIDTFAVDYYWVGGTGDWSDINHWVTSSGGTVKHIQTPTAADNVIFDGNSMNADAEVNLNSTTIFCKNFNASNISNGLRLKGVCQIWRIYGGIKLSKKLFFQVAPTIQFEAQSGNYFIESNGAQIGSPMYFLGNAHWSISDTLRCKNVYLNNGTLSSQSNYIKGREFHSQGATTRQLNLGNSNISFDKWDISGSTFNVNAGMSHIYIYDKYFQHNNVLNPIYYNLTFMGIQGYLYSSSSYIDFHRVKFSGNGSIVGSHRFDSLMFKSSCSYYIAPNSTQTLDQALVAIGDCKRYINIKSSSGHATFTMSNGNVDIYYARLHHIHATGGAGFSDVGGIDLGDNTGWNIQPPPQRTLYWVADTGDWTDTLHWSLISGGQGGECIPTYVDNVIVDQNSFVLPAQPNNNIVLDSIADCHDFTWNNGVVGNLRMDDSIRISGSSFFGSAMQFQKRNKISYTSESIGETIETSNISLEGQVLWFYGQGSWQLIDSINNLEGRIIHTNGHLITNDQYVHVTDFYSSGISRRELSLSNSTIDIIVKFYLLQDSLTVHPNTSHIRFVGDSVKLEVIGDNPVALYNASFLDRNGGGIIETIKTQFNKIAFYRNMALYGEATSDTLLFGSGKDNVFYGRTDSIIRALIAVADCWNPITMRDNIGIGVFHFRMALGAVVNVSSTNLRGCQINGSTPYTATNSGDLGLNVGWNFNYNSTIHYWVGGQGSWHDTIHWSYSTGGLGGACLPMIYDDVIFDANSFNQLHDTVVVDTANAFCRNMTWTNASNTPVFTNSSKNVHYISGSVALIDDMELQYKADIYFVWPQKYKTLNIKAKPIDGVVYFCDTGRWTLLDTLTVLNSLVHFQGDIIANLNTIQAYTYLSFGSLPKLLDIQNINFNLISNFGGMFLWNQDYHTTLLAQNSHIQFFGSGDLLTQGQGQTDYFNVSFLDSNGIGRVFHDTLVTNSFNRLFFQAGGYMYGNNMMDTLIFSKGKNYFLQGGMDQRINSKWIASADCYGEINISGISMGGSATTANVHKQNGNVLLHSVKLKNVNAIGNQTFSIMDGYDLGGNSSNWQIIPTTVRTLYWVNNGGNWFDTTHWSFSSGGPGGECIPTYKDDVFYDSLSFQIFADTVFSLLQTECHNLIWRWTPQEPLLDMLDYMNIYGSIALGDTMSFVKKLGLQMRAVDSSNFIKSSGKQIRELNFITPGGWYLMDDLKVSNSISLKNGRFQTFGHDVYSTVFQGNFNTTRELDIQNSDIILSSNMNLQSNALTFLAANSQIIFDSNKSALSLAITGTQALNFHNVVFAPINIGQSYLFNYTAVKHRFNKMTINNQGAVIGENIFDSLIFHFGNTYKFDEGKTQTIGDYWFIRGNNCYPVNLQSTKRNFQAYVTKQQGNVSGDFINMRDIHAQGGATFYAGDFSADISNNQGWLFSNGPQYVYGLGANVSFNLGSSVTLSTINFNGGPGTTYLWSNGSTSPTIAVNKTGWYYVSVTYAGSCVVRDSIFVGCNLKMNYQTNDNPCNGDSLGLIQALVPDSSFFYQYQWINGDTLDYTDSLPAGSYTVIVLADSGLCQVKDTIDIFEPPPVISPQGDTAFCEEDSVLLDLGSYVTFQWSDSYTSRFRWISQPDTFVISVEDIDGCWSVPDTIDIREDYPPVIYLGQDTTICLNESVLLEAGKGFNEYLWNDNSTLDNLTAYYTGVYWVKVRAKTCIVSDTIELFNCPPKFIVPNVFTPNGDGFNDVFNIDYQNIWEFEVLIYDRWGVRVFQSSDLQKTWDGKVNGREAAEGVYFWQIIYQEYDGKGGGYKQKAVRGTVSLYRSSRY